LLAKVGQTELNWTLRCLPLSFLFFWVVNSEGNGRVNGPIVFRID